MRVFISWSGDLSKELAEAIRNWLPSALQYVKPYFTPADVEKGSKWATEIFKELSASSICVIVLTRDNLDSNWIMFEAGAISSTIDRARVCPIIFELEETDLQGPLAQFQATKFIKADIRKLFFTINAAAGEQKLSEFVAEAVFEKWWPDLEGQISKILIGHKENHATEAIRSDRDLIEELLLLTRKFSADVEAQRAGSTDKKPAPLLAPIKYEGTIHKRIFDLAKLAFDLGGYDHDELKEIKENVDDLLAGIPKRAMAATIKTGLTRDVSHLSSSLEKYLKGEGE